MKQIVLIKMDVWVGRTGRSLQLTRHRSPISVMNAGETPPVATYANPELRIMEGMPMTDEPTPLSPMESRIEDAATRLADMVIEADPSAKWTNGGDFLWTASVVTRGTVDRAARSVRSHIRATGNDPAKLADLNEAVAVLHSAPAYSPPMLGR